MWLGRERIEKLGLPHLIYSELNTGLRWTTHTASGLGRFNKVGFLRGPPLLIDLERVAYLVSQKIF